MKELTISEITEINIERKNEWHKDSDWNPAEWGNALAGETGELCNVLKKLLRVEQGIDSPNNAHINVLLEMAADEIADVFAYLNIIADKLGIDMYQAIANKFNAVSIREGLPQRIPQ